MYFQLPIGNVFSSPESIIFLHVKKASLVFGCVWSAFGNAEITSHIIFMDMNKITEKQWSVTGLCLKKILIGHRRGNIAYFKNRRSRCSVKNSVCSIVISSRGDFSEVRRLSMVYLSIELFFWRWRMILIMFCQRIHLNWNTLWLEDYSLIAKTSCRYILFLFEIYNCGHAFLYMSSIHPLLFLFWLGDQQ